MKKFLKKGLLNLLLTIFFISLSNTSTSYAAESTQPILIETDIVPDAAFTTAIEFAPSYIQTFLGASNITKESPVLVETVIIYTQIKMVFFKEAI